MILPFTQVFAKEVKGASGYILAAMVTGAALTTILFGIPIGALADRFGRKKMLYILYPLFWSANLILVLAFSPFFLVLSGILLGFLNITDPVRGAMEMEMFPASQMGRWLGINRLVKSLFGAAMALVGGMIWDIIGPQYVFLSFICIDLLIKMPLLISIPETLKAK